MRGRLGFLVASATLCLVLAQTEALAQSKLVPSRGAEEEYFGASVDIDGNRAIVGAPGGFPIIEGSAYIYEREGGRWVEKARLTKPAGPSWRRREGAWFGHSVSISGDYAIVGVPGDNVRRLVESGSAYVYVRDGDRWVEQVELIAEDLSSGQEFGWSVDIDGDYAIVGARTDEPKGSAYIFARDGTSWSQQAKLKGGSGPESQDFGWSVDIDGAYAIVGDPEQPRSGNGSAYVFGRHGTVWLPQARLAASDGEANDWFGFSVAIDGEYAVVGAPEHSRMDCGPDEGGCGWSAGAGYVFRRTGTGWSEQAKLRGIEPAEIEVPQISVGTSVSISGDLVILGAQSGHGVIGDEVPLEKGHIGAAYLYRRSGALGWRDVAKIVADDGAEGDNFGVAVAIDGKCPLVGTSLSDSRGHDSGAAYFCGESLRCGPVAIPKLAVEPLKHQFFYNDGGKFELTVHHAGFEGGVGEGAVKVKLTLDLLPGTPPGNSSEAEGTVRRPERFLEGLETTTFPLQPDQEKVFNVEVADLIPRMKDFEKDVLFGANVRIRAWPKCPWSGGSLGPMAFDDELNIYRYLDVADDDHVDGVVTMARTLADGPEGVIRTRPLDLHVHEEAEVELDVESSRDFSAFSGPSRAGFVFNPMERSEQDRQPPSTTVIVETTEGERVGTLEIKGVAEPKHKIFFSEPEFKTTLGQIAELASDAANAQANPPSPFVHPALVTVAEVDLFTDHGLFGDKRGDLAQAIRQQIEKLWAGLEQGFQWADAAGSGSTTTVAWKLRENNRPKRRWAYGVTEQDNQGEIQSIIKKRDEWNRAELGFRLSKAINPGPNATITVHPDSVLESHKGFGDSRMTLTETQFVNALAKTVLHELGHSMSLVHSAQMDDRVETAVEYQKMQLLVEENCDDKEDAAETNWQETTFTLSFEGVATRPITLTRAHQIPWRRVIYTALKEAKSIGNKNYEQTVDEDANGVFMWKCNVIQRDPAANTPPDLVIERCQPREVPAAEACRTFILEFRNHLGGADVGLLEIDPTKGTVVQLQAGGTDLPLKGRVPQQHAKKDIMYGGFNDIQGELRPQQGVSFEILKMALALDYTQQEVDKVVEMYDAFFKEEGELK